MRTCFAAIVGLTMAFGPTAVLAAQEKIPLLPREGRMDPKSITVVGCVATGTSAGTYSLTDLTRQGVATDRDSMKSLTLVLTGTEINLGQHVGHKVSLTGVHGDARMSGIGTTGTEKPAAEGALKNDDTKKTTGTFTVKSLTMLAASCSQSGN
jgi:hypothetical protein